ncbi:hypothetical protein [Oerskovia jenensis]|uniref:hypothetical protein n=1 Tax=Oerskovia jenensis TaxID=162169 RepID=UPI0036DF695F
MAQAFTYTPGGGDVIGHLRAGRDRGVHLVGEQILTTSRQRVPHEEGTLERSGATSAVEDGRVTISYDTVYAVRQHEDMSLRHDDGRQAKYLETAMADNVDVARVLLAQAIRSELGT